MASPGQPLLIIGDTSSLQVETTDLDEIDVAQIQPGQDAIITFEAIPDIVFNGTIDSVAPMAQPGEGGVNYTAYLKMETMHPLLKWGMTAFVDINTPE